jgi:hypothetical protein
MMAQAQELAPGKLNFNFNLRKREPLLASAPIVRGINP